MELLSGMLGLLDDLALVMLSVESDFLAFIFAAILSYLLISVMLFSGVFSGLSELYFFPGSFTILVLFPFLSGMMLRTVGDLVSLSAKGASISKDPLQIKLTFYVLVDALFLIES